MLFINYNGCPRFVVPDLKFHCDWLQIKTMDNHIR